MHRRLLPLITFAALVAASTSAQAQWGSLKGKFVYDGDPPPAVKLDVNKDLGVCDKHPLVDESLVVDKDSRGLANVVIYLRTKDVQVHPDYEASAGGRVEFDNKGCRFEPHVVTIRLSQTLVLKNSDPVGHNSNVQPVADQGINPLLPAGAEVTHQFGRAQTVPVQVSCNIHPWMKGYILPRDNPYMAVSATDGTFEIKNLPAGDLEFQAWQEKSGYLAVTGWEKGRFTVTIKDGATEDLGAIKVPPALFNK